MITGNHFEAVLSGPGAGTMNGDFSTRTPGNVGGDFQATIDGYKAKGHYTASLNGTPTPTPTPDPDAHPNADRYAWPTRGT